MLQLLALHAKFENMASAQFSREPLFLKALKDAHIVFVNKDASKKHSNTEMISTYCDRILKGGEKLGDDQIEERLGKIKTLWDGADFMIMGHRESTTVFILCGLDDIHTRLEDNRVLATSTTFTRGGRRTAGSCCGGSTPGRGRRRTAGSRRS